MEPVPLLELEAAAGDIDLAATLDGADQHLYLYLLIEVHKLAAVKWAVL